MGTCKFVVMLLYVPKLVGSVDGVASSYVQGSRDVCVFGPAVAQATEPAIVFIASVEGGVVLRAVCRQCYEWCGCVKELVGVARVRRWNV